MLPKVCIKLIGPQVPEYISPWKFTFDVSAEINETLKLFKGKKIEQIGVRVLVKDEGPHGAMEMPSINLQPDTLRKILDAEASLDIDIIAY